MNRALATVTYNVRTRWGGTISREAPFERVAGEQTVMSRERRQQRSIPGRAPASADRAPSCEA